jgi:phospholipase/carboxylesterase
VDLAQPGMTRSRTLRELSAAARGVRRWLEREHDRRIALVGWSQGGALAVHLLRQQPERFVSAAVVAGFVADTRPHAGMRSRRPPVWYGMGGRDDVIPAAMAARSRRWLGEHASATLVDLPDEDHMLSPTFVGSAFEFTAAALARAG